MKDQSNFVSASHVFIALGFLFGVFLNFKSALRYDGLENNFVADNWGSPLVILLTVIFGLGWWLGSVVRYLVLAKGHKIAALAFAGVALIFFAIQISSLAVMQSGFLYHALTASGLILMSSFFLRYSLVFPQVIAKPSEGN